MIILQYIGAILGVTGALFVAYKNKFGFIIWLVGNACWMVYGIATKQWGVAVQFAIFWIIALLGLINWSKSKPQS
ncbi:MAG: hypothetical protein Q8N59_02695 [bacterium]|nr:hypothetical protein [bacterium]